MALRYLLFALVLIPLTACGTLQVGIELPTPLSPNASATPAAHSIPSAMPTQTRTPGASPTGSPASLATSPAGPTPTRATERINFPVGGTNFTFTTRLSQGSPERYVLTILAQQEMTITTSRNVTVEVLDRQGNPLKPTTGGPGQWQGTVPQTGDYVIVLRGEGFVTVSIDIPP